MSWAKLYALCLARLCYGFYCYADDKDYYLFSYFKCYICCYYCYDKYLDLLECECGYSKCYAWNLSTLNCSSLCRYYSILRSIGYWRHHYVTSGRLLNGTGNTRLPSTWLSLYRRNWAVVMRAKHKHTHNNIIYTTAAAHSPMYTTNERNDHLHTKCAICLAFLCNFWKSYGRRVKT